MDKLNKPFKTMILIAVWGQFAIRNTVSVGLSSMHHAYMSV